MNLNQNTNARAVSSLDAESTSMLERIKADLLQLKPNARHQKQMMFAELLPIIVQMRSMRVPQRAILDALASHGLKLHPARFKELLDAHLLERKNPEGAPEPPPEEDASENGSMTPRPRRPFPSPLTDGSRPASSTYAPEVNA